MLDTKEIVIVGRIGAVYGLKGWLKINSYTTPKENICNYKQWLIHNNHLDQWEKHEHIDVRPHGKTLIAKLPQCNDCDTARSYTGAQIAIYRHQLPTLDEGDYYWSDLIGLTVYNQDDVCLGTIKQLLETGANDVLVIRGEKEHLIPYIPNTFVLNIDLEKKTMHVNWDPEF